MKLAVTRMTGVTAVAVMLAMGAGSAMAGVDSATWESSFEADALAPVGGDPWHGFSENGTVVPDGSNNYINFGPSGALDGVRSTNLGAAYANTNGGASFEIRARHNGGGNLDVWGHIMTTSAATDTHKYWLTYYLEDGQMRINNSNSWDFGDATVPHDTSQWTKYRFTMDGTDWNLYIDDDPTPAATLTAIPNADDGNPHPGYFAFFHGYGGSTDADIDYLRYTDMGAIPVPEPATMAALGLGGLMLRRLRRRRNR